MLLVKHYFDKILSSKDAEGRKQFMKGLNSTLFNETFDEQQPVTME